MTSSEPPGNVPHEPAPSGRRIASFPVTYLVVGPPRHGVVRHALHTTRTIREHAPEAVRIVQLPNVAAWKEWATTAPEDPVHVDVTDALFGSSPQQAAAVLGRLLPDRSTLTLHDIPQPAEGSSRYEARAAAYLRLVRRAGGVVVASDHEAGLLRAMCATDDVASATPVRIVPLPVADHRDEAAARAAASDPAGYAAAAGLPEELRGLEHDAVVLGFLYPGKGHVEAIDAVAGVRRDLGPRAPSRVTALGAVAQGHENLVDELQERAASQGIEFRCTGFVAGSHLDAALRSAAVPVAAHRHVSASGSLTSWMSVGRRAVVPHGSYVAEMERLRPGTLAVQPQDLEPTGALVRGIRAAVTHPEKTWLAPHTSLAPGPAEAAVALVGIWAEWHR